MFDLNVHATSAHEARHAAAVLTAFAMALDAVPALTPETVATAFVREAAGAAEVEGVAEQPTTRRGPGRPRKAPVDPVAGYTALGGTLPVPTPEPTAEEPASTAPKPTESVDPPVAEQPASTTPEPTSAATASRDDMLAEVRTFAQEHPKGGALWVRAVLTRHKVQRMSELTDDAVREVVAEVAALRAAS